MDGIARACSLLPAPEETFSHLFFDCPITNNLKKNFIQTYVNQLGIYDRVTDIKKPIPNTVNLFLKTTLCVFQFLIWEAKLKKTTPALETILLDLFYVLKGSLKCSAKLIIGKDVNRLSNLFSHRRWNEL